MQKHVSESDVSTIVWDAIRVAHEMGISYIWIDAICIVQDDLPEWETEARKMFSIYENAEFTLALIGFPGADHRLFSPREACRYPLEPLQVGTTIFYPNRPDLIQFHERAWTRRAWTLQEEAASRRILYWDHSALFWECLEERKCEWGHGHDHKMQATIWAGQGSPLKWSSEPSTITRRKNTFGLPFNTMDHNVYNIDGAWDLVFKKYRERECTMPGDWTVAIRGLVDIVQSLQPEDRLIWGVWKSKFIESLFWYMETGDQGSSTFCSSVHRRHAPSWSQFSRLGRGTISTFGPGSWVDVLAECEDILAQDTSPFPAFAAARVRGWILTAPIQPTLQLGMPASFGESHAMHFLPVLRYRNREQTTEGGRLIRGLVIARLLREEGFGPEHGHDSFCYWQYTGAWQEVAMSEDDFADLNNIEKEVILLF